MKNVLLILLAFFAYTAGYSQCNLSVTNNTSDNFDLVAVDATADCTSPHTTVLHVASVSASSTTSITNTNSYWIGIQITDVNGSPVIPGLDFGNPVHGCTPGTLGYTVTWGTCSVTIDP